MTHADDLKCTDAFYFIAVENLMEACLMAETARDLTSEVEMV